jgi:hypothetical protein
LRWLVQVEEDLKKMKVRNWREKCKDGRLSNEIIKQAKTHQVVAPTEEEEEVVKTPTVIFNNPVCMCVYICIWSSK